MGAVAMGTNTDRRPASSSSLAGASKSLVSSCSRNRHSTPTAWRTPAVRSVATSWTTCTPESGGRIDRRTRQNRVGFLTSECHQFYENPARGTDGIPDADEDTEFDRLKLEFSNYAGPSPVSMALSGDEWGDDLVSTIREEFGSSLGMGALAGQRPRKGNRITLDTGTKDDHGNPVPKIHWRVDGRTRATLRRANEIQRAILDELDAEITWQVGPDETGPAFHHMGTTRMGTDPEKSVVNAQLRTHDLRNCTVASSSAFVTSGAMNPTLTIVALSLKAANHVDERL